MLILEAKQPYAIIENDIQKDWKSFSRLDTWLQMKDICYLLDIFSPGNYTYKCIILIRFWEWPMCKVQRFLQDKLYP